MAIGQDVLEPLIVTASRSEQSRKDVPYSSDVIDSGEVRDGARRSLPDVLVHTPGVLVQKTAHGHGSPFIRGLTGRRNLLMVDGVRVNNSTWRSGPVQYWNTVDSYALERVELIKNQGSVLYGSDAAGGTMNTFTRSSDFMARDEGEAYAGGSMYYEYRTNGDGSHVGRMEAETGVGGKFGLLFGMTLKDFGDIEDSAVGLMDGTGYPEQDYDFRADYAVTSDSQLTFAMSYVNQDDVSRWHRTLGNPGWTHGSHVADAGKWNADLYDQERMLSYLRYSGENPAAGALIQKWSATLSYQNSDDSTWQDRNPDSDSIRASHIDVQTLGLDVTLESEAGPGRFVYGMDYYHDEVDSSGYRTNSAGTTYSESLPVADDSEYDLFGAFAQYLWTPDERWEVTAGGRCTYAEASLGRYYDETGAIQTDQSQDWTAFVGSLRALYRVNPCWSLYGGVSQAFRAPNLDDLTGNVTAKSGNTALGSTDVEPEQFVTYEVGIRHGSEEFSADLAFFYTDIDEMIADVAVSATDSDTITTNGSEGYVYGVELSGSWRFHPQWTLSGFAAWQDGRLEVSDYLGGPVVNKPMNRQMPLTGSLALRWTESGGRYWIEGRVLAAAEEDRLWASDQASDSQRIPTGGTPGYFVTALRGGWDVNEHLDLTCSLENVTDEDYRYHGSGQNEPGFNAIIGAKVTW